MITIKLNGSRKLANGLTYDVVECGQGPDDDAPVLRILSNEDLSFGPERNDEEIFSLTVQEIEKTQHMSICPLGWAVGEPSLGSQLVVSSWENFGAIALFFAGAMDHIYDTIGAFYALPSSVHEWICIADAEGDERALKLMVQDINATVLTPDEFMSDNIWHYDRRNGFVMIQ